MSGGANHSRLRSRIGPDGGDVNDDYSSGLNDVISRLSSLSDMKKSADANYVSWRKAGADHRLKLPEREEEMNRAPLPCIRIALSLACCLGMFESMLGCSSDPQKGGEMTTELTADDARDALIAVARNDPDLRWICGGDRFVQTLSVIRKKDEPVVEIGPFECNLATLKFSVVANSDRHGFAYEGRFVGDGAKWKAVVEKKAHTYK